ncbi:MAG: glutaredoxin 3 [Gammaproteobacteria bacterium]|nr:glutaredoxin 3 [Gammaproteobacteria bacterium]
MKIEIFTREQPFCPYCVNAKKWLQANNLLYTNYDINTDGVLEDLENRLGHKPKTVPQIFIDGELIGGYTDLIASDFAKSLIRRDLGGLTL